ncbi:MAG: N-6 DNA methylase [bacterium]|nr:N-6 DNA methylase [bacterium]
MVKAGDVIKIEEQKSDDPRINKLLATASKKGSGVGKPEFIITFRDRSDLLIVVECKADVSKHESADRDKYAEYAVDGALLYASYLSKGFDVIAIAVSGQTKRELKVSHFLQLKGNRAIEILGNKLLPPSDYLSGYLKSPEKFRQDYEALIVFGHSLNDILHAKKIKEAHRSLLISGILVALENKAFAKSYTEYHDAKQLSHHLAETIVSELKSSDLSSERIAGLQHAFSFIKSNTTLIKDRDFVIGLIEKIDENVNHFVRTHRYYDAIGQFYVQFLRYANNDKGLGIVLTPAHIAELFAGIAGANKNSIVFDNCCGTGGLLIAAMKRMLLDAGDDSEIQNSIKSSQLIGIEHESDIYALAVSNMYVHGDGKTNIKAGDCFDLSKEISDKFKPTIGLLNPPYKTKASETEELDFVLNNLDTLVQNGTCVAILPFSCAISDEAAIVEKRRQILERHTLEAAMSMPSDLFHESKSNVATCILVFTAHKPHHPAKKSWFGYWRDDGFIKVRNKGRIDANGTWNEIKDRWVTAFHNRETIKEMSITRSVSYDDEWCAEAYMEPDWSNLNKEALSKTFKEFAIHKLLTEIENA